MSVMLCVVPLALLAACGGKPAANAAVAAPQATAVLVQPASVELAAGARMQLQAQVNDAAGQAIGGVAIDFQSKDSKVAAVTPKGLVSAVGPVGDTVVTVASGIRVAQVAVHVGPGPAAAIVPMAGPPASAQIGKLIGEVRVQVVDQFKNPVPGAPLAWVPAQPGDRVESASPATGADGAGSAQWYAGSRSGEHVLEVRSAALAAQTLRTQVAAGAPAAIKFVTGPPLANGAAVQAGSDVIVRVVVLDAHQNGVPDAEVALAATGKCGFAAARQRTDATGSTPAAAWTPAGSGACTLIARLPGAPLEASLKLRIARAPRAGSSG